jgi:hypothetical protein
LGNVPLGRARQDGKAACALAARHDVVGNWQFPTGGTFGTNDLGCGKVRKVSVGGILTYDVGPANLQVILVHDVNTKDQFNGTPLCFRVSFKVLKKRG